MKRSASAKLPAKLTLPSGRVVKLRRTTSRELPPLARAAAAPLFAEVELAFTEGRVAVTDGGRPIELGALVLRDFHVLRAVLARSGIVDEAEVAIACRNCGAPMGVRPCALLEIGPWVDGEIDDPELDATLPFGEAIEIASAVPLGRVRSASTLVFEDRTVARAGPLFAAVVRSPMTFTAEVVSAMGLVSLGSEKRPEAIARALETCDDAALLAIEDAFMATHYPARLGCVVFCKACGARNDVDAPYERELRAMGACAESPAEGDHEFPTFEAFAARAREIARGMLHDMPGEPVELCVEGETPAVDDGGEPLLGSYMPPHPGDASMPSRSPVVTVYFRTFAAMWGEDGPYDWDDELVETIEHELEHHVSFLRGDDPTDDEERAVIRDEAVRIVGRREAGRRAIEGFGASWGDFVKRTWPLWLLAVIALAAMLATQH